jgi:hypothetical protein
MATLNIDLTTDPTLDAVDRAMEAAQVKDLRPYIGMSQIGHPCGRKLWYSFRFAKQNSFDAESLKRFADGFHGEDVQAERLRMVDFITLHTHEPDGNQFGFKSFGGHFSGHMDGAILGLLQAPKTWHVWEHKQVGQDKFNKLIKLKVDLGEKAALAKWNEVYYAQAVLYMEYTGMARHYLTCATPGGRDTISVRTEENKDLAKKLIDKAEFIIFSGEPPVKLSNDPAFYQCKFCDFSEVCHGTQAPLVTCRSCVHATPERSGLWSCAFHKLSELTLEAQKEACVAHRYIPSLLANFAAVDSGSLESNTVTYKNTITGNMFSNTEGGANDYTSHEIYHANDKRVLGDPMTEELREEFGAVIVGEIA